MRVNYDRVCRLCLSSRGELLPIFPTTSSDDSEPSGLASKIRDCVSVEINEDDDLPTNVCRKCCDNVNNWHIFKDICERSQNKLQRLIKNDGSQLEEVQIKNEPLSDEAYDDGVVIEGSYPDLECASTSSKVQAEGPPILASLGLTPRSDKGMESENNEEEDEEMNEDEMNGTAQQYPSMPAMPEVSITVMRPTGETLHARQGIQQLASKECLVCGRSYRYSHNARRHELNAHSFDRYTNKVTAKKSHNTHMQPKLRPNPFNPKARLMPNPISHKMQLIPKGINAKIIQNKALAPPKPIPVKTPKGTQNNLPYPLRIKALKDLQIKKKEPQILKTLLTTKPEVLVSEPEILNSGPESPETLISEPEIASFQVETILSEPDTYIPQDDDDVDGEMQNNQGQNYDTVDMDSENEIEIARQKENAGEDEGDGEGEGDGDGESGGGGDHLVINEGEEGNEMDNDDENNMERQQSDNENDQADDNVDSQDGLQVGNENDGREEDDENGHETKEGDEGNYERDDEQVEYNQDDDDEELPPIAPVVEINEDMQTNSYNSEGNDEDLDETADPNDTAEDVKELDPDKLYVTKTQRDFILKYRDIIEQINTKRCLCCDREHPRRKAVIQHLQKNGHKVPKHTCYNCVVTFGHIGALLSHMRSNTCTDLWKIIYNENGITEDLVLEDEPKDTKVAYKDIFNARSYACKLCPAKFQLKQFIMKHVLDVHEDGQSRVQLVCVHCNSRFKDKALWKRHIRNGECTVYISCDLCSERFGNMQHFNDHALAVHAGNFDQSDNQNKCVDGRPTDCPVCGKKNSSYPNLVKHLKIIHNEEKPHYCQHCDSKFEQAADLNKHIYMEHSDRTLGVQSNEPDMSLVKEEAEEYHYSCTECNAIFETVDAWTDHQVAEHNQVAHHCDQCDKKFLRPSELAEHKNTHLRVKFYPCNICSNSYSTPQKLSEHVQQNHPGAAGAYAPVDYDFFCDICIRSFKSRQAYSNHMRIHAKVPTTNRKPGEPKGFAPQIVGKPIRSFSMVQPNFLSFKPNCNVPNAPYSCDICGKGFMHKKNIWKHKKVLHADTADRNDSEENTMQASTEEDEFNLDENGVVLSTPQFNSFNFTNLANNLQQQAAQTPQEAAPYSCELCFKRFPLRTSLWKHKRAKHGIINASASGSSDSPIMAGEGGRSSCTICKITFSDKKSYYRHRKNVHKSSAQMCKICGKPLNSTLELYEHLKAAHARELLGYNASQGPTKQEGTQELEGEYDGDQDSVDPSAEYQARYPCDQCGKQFVGLLALQNHQCVNQLQSSPQTFDCEICHKSYTSISALKSHRGWHLRSPDGKAAANNSGLWMPQHKVTSKVSKHEVVDPSQLARVSHSTPTPASVAKRRLPPEVEVTVVNPNKKLRSDDSVELEQQNNSSTGADDRYCNICDKEFTKRAAYQRHMDEVHQPNSVFCPVCEKSFTRKSTLIVHMKKHYGGEGSSSAADQNEDDGLACDICGAQCDNENALRAHRAMHHGDDSGESEDEGSSAPPPGEFTCGQCGDGVATPRDLIAHRTMHATPTKFYCNICKVYFARAIDLSSHTRARHSDNEKVFFPCAMCDRFYMNKKSLQRHIEMAH
ncbi:zinc finger protein Xfin [Papilio machaon]|uniref:zinc finger protein Xfin n=1 Tax=Papilio machaon TaxID=76193 RepID=UPI001E66455B|nr:zinc finger protein Xfin [Papilio machaon]